MLVVVDVAGGKKINAPYTYSTNKLAKQRNSGACSSISL